MMIDPVWLVIGGMALVTFAERSLGFYVAKSMPLSPRVKQTLQILPGVVLIALVAPGLIAGGWTGWIGGAVLLILYFTTKKNNLSIFTALGVVILLRAIT